MLWWTYAGHGALFCVWCFLIVFGNVMEARQLDSLELLCSDGDGERNEYIDDIVTSCPSDLVYSEDGNCCIVSSDWGYHNAYKILSVVGGTLAAAHVAFFSHLVISAMFRKIGGILFIFHRVVDGTSLFVVFVGVAYVYQHLVYHVFFCHHNSASCAHPAREHWVIQRLFYSLLAISAPYLAIQVCRTVALGTIFAFHRHKTLSDVMNIENLLDVLGDEIESTFSARVVTRYRNVRNFVQVWMEKNDEDVSVNLEGKARRILAFLWDGEQPPQSRSKSHSPPRDAQVIDGNNHDDDDAYNSERGLPFSRFRKTLAKNDVPESKILEIWDKVTEPDLRHVWQDNEDNEAKHNEASAGESSRTSMTLSCKGLQDMLYELFFCRKELIHSMHTDHFIVTYLARIVAVLVYPASFIAVARIFGYQNAFGSGVDLFKTYMLAASYIITSFKDDVSFLLSMLTDRPINLGDVLLVDGETYKVRRFSMTHFYMDGPHYISVPNSRFSSSTTINLSKQGITDSLCVSFPLTSTEKEMNREKMFAIMYAYQAANDRDISRSSIRCGWASAPDGSTKVMQCNWRYKFRIFDRARLNWARANMRHHILERLELEMGQPFLKYHVAGGGGLNDLWYVERTAPHTTQSG